MKKILLILAISTAQVAYAQVDPETADKCKDARDFLGCVKAFSTTKTPNQKQYVFFRIGGTSKNRKILQEHNQRMNLPNEKCFGYACLVDAIEKERFGAMKPYKQLEFKYETGSNYLFPRHPQRCS